MDTLYRASMPLTFLRTSALLLLFSVFSFQAHAESKISVKADLVSIEDAAELATQVEKAELPALDGVAAGLTPLNQINHSDALWLLAVDATGTQVWLSHDGESWELKSPPLAPLRSELQPGGQAHTLALGIDSANQATFYTYNAITNMWAQLGNTQIDGVVTGVQTSAEGFIIASLDDARETQLTHFAVAFTKQLLKPFDWLLIVTYLTFTAGIGFYYYKMDKNKTGEDFFVGGRSIPWWAAGVSLYATGTSAISYIATPAKAYAENWLYLANNVVGMVGTIFVAIWIVPLIRRLDLMSVYQYLEMRFHPAIRVLASALAIILQLGGRMSIVLFLPSLAMSAVTGINVTTAILIMGIITIGYTVMGGMKAVIWTDFIQVIVMLGGAFVAIGYILLHVDGGTTEFFRIAIADNKMETFNWDLSLTQATVWGFIMLNILGVLVYPQDQVMMQRVLSTKSDKDAGKSVWTLAAIVIPGNLMFFGIGTALYVFYKQYPANLNPLLDTDSTFPQFIAAELPVGVTGLIIAGIFAASMSTLSSSINSVATLVSVDFYEKYAKKSTPEKSLQLAQIITIVAGIIGIGTALLLAGANIKSALDTSFALMGLLGGGFAGCYALGMFTTRANWQGTYIGVAVSLVVTFFVWHYELVHVFFYIFIANLVTIVVGYVASLFFPAPEQSLHGLTIYTPNKQKSEPAA